MSLLQEVQNNIKTYKLNLDAGFSNILKSVEDILRHTSQSGATMCLVDINHLVNIHMSPKTPYDEICTRLKEYLESEGFICEEVSQYKETSLQITWAEDSTDNSNNSISEDISHKHPLVLLSRNELESKLLNGIGGEFTYNKNNIQLEFCYCELGRSGKDIGYGLRVIYNDAQIWTGTDYSYESLIKRFNNDNKNNIVIMIKEELQN